MSAEHDKVHPNPGYVYVHVHEGTLISAWGFDALDEAIAFRAKYDGNDENQDRRNWEDVPELPTGWRDDPDSDTWILVVVDAGITLVDGEEVEDGRPHIKA